MTILFNTYNTEEVEPTPAELAEIEKQMEMDLNTWDIAKCPRCRQKFSLLQVHYDSERRIICPRCHGVID